MNESARSNTDEKCPKCGSAKKEGFPNAMAWECMSHPRDTEPKFVQSYECLSRQVAQLQAEVKELRTPDFWWVPGREEESMDDPRDEAEEAWPDAAIVQGAKELDYEVHMAYGPDSDEFGSRCIGKFKSLAEAQIAAKAAQENGK